MRLGLVAMSGVRVQNAELNAMGVTLPGFIERSRVIASLPSLSLLTLAGMTREDVDVSHIEISDLADFGELPDEYDAVAISSYTAQIKDAYELADRLRLRGIKVILGGPHVSALPDEACRHADAIVLGEAEPVWPRVVDDLRNRALASAYDARRINFDLRHAPVPRFELLEPDRYNRLTVQTQRGCPWLCDFCASSPLLTPRFKAKPVDKVISEIRRIKSIWRKPFVEFADDNTFANKAHGKRLLHALAREDIRWFTETDISVADDSELLSMLRDSGCAQLLIGLEAPDGNALDGIEAKANWKAARADGYFDAIERIQSRGISVNGCFVLGLDTQDESSFSRVLDFVRESRLHEVQITIATPFPGTPFHARLRAEGRLLEGAAWECATLFDVMFEPKRMSRDRLEQQFRWLASHLYSDEFAKWRRNEFRHRLRQTR
jgi:radical SAM superfamily enzyme YgiQ (UPF0313 family)